MNTEEHNNIYNPSCKCSDVNCLASFRKNKFEFKKLFNSKFNSYRNISFAMDYFVLWNFENICSNPNIRIFSLTLY